MFHSLLIDLLIIVIESLQVNTLCIIIQATLKHYRGSNKYVNKHVNICCAAGGIF